MNRFHRYISRIEIFELDAMLIGFDELLFGMRCTAQTSVCVLPFQCICTFHVYFPCLCVLLFFLSISHVCFCISRLCVYFSCLCVYSPILCLYFSHVCVLFVFACVFSVFARISQIVCVVSIFTNVALMHKS
jgi:hypothetical protein